MGSCYKFFLIKEIICFKVYTHLTLLIIKKLEIYSFLYPQHFVQCLKYSRQIVFIKWLHKLIKLMKSSKSHWHALFFLKFLLQFPVKNVCCSPISLYRMRLYILFYIDLFITIIYVVIISPLKECQLPTGSIHV